MQFQPNNKEQMFKTRCPKGTKISTQVKCQAALMHKPKNLQNHFLRLMGSLAFKPKSPVIQTREEAAAEA